MTMVKKPGHVGRNAEYREIISGFKQRRTNLLDRSRSRQQMEEKPAFDALRELHVQNKVQPWKSTPG